MKYKSLQNNDIDEIAESEILDDSVDVEDYQEVFEDYPKTRLNRKKPLKTGSQIHWLFVVLIIMLLVIGYEFGGGFRPPVEMGAVNELLIGIPVDFEADYIGQQNWARDLEIFDTKLKRIDSKSFEDEAELEVVYENNSPDRQGEMGLGLRQVIFTVREGKLVWVEMNTDGVGDNIVWELPEVGTITETPEYAVVFRLGLPHNRKRGPSFIQYRNHLSELMNKREYVKWCSKYYSLLYESQLTYNSKSPEDKYAYKLRLNFHNGYLSAIKIGKVPESEMNLH